MPLLLAKSRGSFTHFAGATNLKSREGIMPFFFSKESNHRSGARLGVALAAWFAAISREQWCDRDTNLD